MEVLFAPWRMEYILAPKPEECIFCLDNEKIDPDEDKKRLILARTKKAFVIMNKYPYNNGHLMVAPFRHINRLADLVTEEALEIFGLLRICEEILQADMSPDGANVGLNLGKAAGAGFAGHLHFQFVPRFIGDSSFMSVFSETRVLPEHLNSTYERLKPLFDAALKYNTL